MTKPHLIDLSSAHYATIAQLWQRCLDDRWPIPDWYLRNYLFYEIEGVPSTHLGAMRGDELIGVAASHRCGQQSGLVLLLVDPDYQGQGIGMRLVEAICARQYAAGATQIRVGSNWRGRFWPGVPEDCAAAARLLDRRGFETGPMFSLVQDVSEYSAQVRPGAATYKALSVGEGEELMAFQNRCFAGWASDFERPIREERYRDIIVAWADDRIVGALNIRSAERPHIWHRILGDDMGEIDNVGLDEGYRGQGIGAGLVDYTVLELQRRGVRNVLIECTWLRDFFGRLGFEVWRQWTICKAALPLSN